MDDLTLLFAALAAGMSAITFVAVGRIITLEAQRDVLTRMISDIATGQATTRVDADGKVFVQRKGTR